MTYTLEEARQAVIAVALRLKESNLIVRTYGNISCRVNEDQFVITPSGRDYETLKSEDIVLMNISDGSYEGNILPSSEYLVHRITYKLHPGAQCVIHTHQAAASALSILGRNFSDLHQYMPEGMLGDFSLIGNIIPTSTYGENGSKALMKSVGTEWEKYPMSQCLLMKNHGVLCYGSSAVEAYHKATMLERMCSWIYSSLTGIDADELSTDKIYNVDFRKKLKWSKGSSWISQQTTLYVVSPFVIRQAVSGLALVPYLDDVAQAIGPIAMNMDTDVNQVTLGKVLQDMPVVFMKGKGALCIGSDTEESRDVCQILEKGCMAAYLARKVKGIDPLPDRLAQAERNNYLKSYSKRRK